MLAERAAPAGPAALAPIAPPRLGPSLPVGWPIILMLGGLFVWWFLGLSGVIQATLAIPLLATLVLRRNLLMPRIFWAWLLFVGWMLLSAIQIDDFTKALTFSWRASIYIASTIIFLFVFNTSRRDLPARRIVYVLAAFWVLTVVGGLLGMAFPNRSFPSLLGSVLPARIQSSAFVHALVTPETTGGNVFAGTGIFRVKAPFIYTNQWGSAFALTLPFAFAALGTMRSALWRKALIGLIVVSIVPLIFSLDRGSWLSAAAAVTYGVFRLARARGGRSVRLARTLRVMLVGGAIVGLIVALTPLGSLVLLRVNAGYGDKHRAVLYESSLILVERSPLLGYGGPVEISVVNPNAPPGPSAGTHGTFWTVLVSNGVPAMLFFVGWFLLAFLKTRRRLPEGADVDDNARFWSHVALLAAIVQLGYYEVLPWGLPIVMVAAATALREANAASAWPAPPVAPEPARVPARALPS
jgi:hypothetical protein